MAPSPSPSRYLSRRGLLAAVGGGLASVAAGALRPETVLPALDIDPRVPAGEWPTYKHDPTRTGYQPEPGPRDGLVAAADRVLTVGRYATRALAADDGSLEWTTRQDDRFAGTFPGERPYEFVQTGPYVAGDLDGDHGPVTDGDGVYLTGETTTLALDAATGERRDRLRRNDESRIARRRPGHAVRPDPDGRDGAPYRRRDRAVRALEGDG